MRAVKALYFICVIGGAVAAYLLDRFASNAFSTTYSRLQGSLFTGLLTTASFLLSLKAFILLRIRADVLDTVTYQSHMKALTGGSLDNLYLPLRNLSQLLIWTGACALIGSVSQLTISFLSVPYGTYISAGLAAGALALVIVCWKFLSDNVRAWVDAVEREHREKPPT